MQMVPGIIYIYIYALEKVFLIEIFDVYICIAL
jgi:hypothetical protein